MKAKIALSWLQKLRMKTMGYVYDFLMGTPEGTRFIFSAGLGHWPHSRGTKNLTTCSWEEITGVFVLIPDSPVKVKEVERSQQDHANNCPPPGMKHQEWMFFWQNWPPQNFLSSRNKWWHAIWSHQHMNSFKTITVDEIPSGMMCRRQGDQKLPPCMFFFS